MIGQTGVAVSKISRIAGSEAKFMCKGSGKNHGIAVFTRVRRIHRDANWRDIFLVNNGWIVMSNYEKLGADPN